MKLNEDIKSENDKLREENLKLRTENKQLYGERSLILEEVDKDLNIPQNPEVSSSLVIYLLSAI